MASTFAAAIAWAKVTTRARGLSNRRHSLDLEVAVKIVHLLRHAKAKRESAGTAGDHGRPLTKRGQTAAAAMARHMAESGFTVDRVFCSTSTRTKETLAPLLTLLRGTPVAYRDRLYMIDSDDLLAFLKTLPETARSVLLVGHDPAYHGLACQLIGKAPGQNEAWRNLKEKFSKGALCSISFDVTTWDDLKPRGGTLRAFVRPGDLDH